MNEVPERYRQVINPYQTPKEIASAVKFCSRIAFHILGVVSVTGEEEGWDVYAEVFGLNRPPRKW
jgi:hypothetical protein